MDSFTLLFVFPKSLNPNFHFLPNPPNNHPPLHHPLSSPCPRLPRHHPRRHLQLHHRLRHPRLTTNPANPMLAAQQKCPTTHHFLSKHHLIRLHRRRPEHPLRRQVRQCKPYRDGRQRKMIEPLNGVFNSANRSSTQTFFKHRKHVAMAAFPKLGIK